MDLERCPKCGVIWKKWDKCPQCGFVPIGVGLDKLPKKEKPKKPTKYREPGSSGGFLSLVLLGAIGYGAYAYQPWADDWELVRNWLGQGRHHSVVGDWVIEKVVSTGKDSPLISGHDIDQGLLKFNDKGIVDVELFKGDDKTQASGRYLVQGTVVSLKGMQSSSEAAGAFPHSVNMSLHWTGPNAVIASYHGTETIYLRRNPLGGRLAKLMELGIKPDAEKTPGDMRGALATMRQSANDAANGGG